MSTAQFTTPLIVVIPGQLITASLWNGEFQNNFTNLNPLGIGAYSDTDTQMQTATDPFPSGTSRPTSMGGELERIRYILDLIIGKTYWYEHPSITLESLSTETPSIPAGTVMIFSQPAVPVGWTLVTSEDERFLQLRTTFGGDGIGGTWLPSVAIPLAHSHTVNSHTHDLANHTHTMGNHTHSTPNHQHQIAVTNITGNTTGGTNVFSTNVDGADLVVTPSATSTAARRMKNQTENSGSGTSGAPTNNTSDGPTPNTSGGTAPGTDSQLTDISLRYINVIRGSKD